MHLVKLHLQFLNFLHRIGIKYFLHLPQQQVLYIRPKYLQFALKQGLVLLKVCLLFAVYFLFELLLSL